MDVVDVVRLISGLITGFCAGVGTFAYIWLRKWAPRVNDRLEWCEFDIDLMYRMHKLQSPSEARQHLIDEMNSRETKHD